MGIRCTPAEMKRFFPETKVKDAPKEFVEPGLAILNGRLIILVAADTANETNQRKWKAKNRRAGQAWTAVRQAIGPNLGTLASFARYYESGKVLRVKFVRLGGRKMDRSGIPAATKGVEDAVAYLLGCNDGDVRWLASWDQETGGPCGVRVEVEIACLATA